MPSAGRERRSFLRGQDFLEHRAARFPHPATAKDLVAPMDFFKVGRENSGTFEGGIQNGIIAIIASPKFLYRAEPPPAGLAPGTNYRISDLELASRLSFFLWSTVPDDELLSIAEQGKLKDPKIFEQQVRRMLASPRSRSLVTNFASEWLRLRDLDTIDPDPFIYPNFDPSLRAAFRTELELFVDSIQREDRSVLDLLSANYTFVNERLALHYGIPNVRGEAFRRVILPDSRRYGLLGKGAVLMVTSYANRTSVVLRGNYILENLIGTPPSPPPPNVPAFKENKEGEKPHTVRETMELHRANPTCNACHGIIDPLGFALEKFRHRGGVARQGSLYANRHRRLGQAGGWHRGERAGRPAQSAAVAPRPVRRDHDRKILELCSGPQSDSLRHADGSQDRARRRAR